MISESGSIAERPSHRFAEHTGEVRMEVSAPTLEGLFAEAGRGLAEVMLGTLDATPCVEEREHDLSVRSRDLPSLLVDWLNELIFLSETSKQVFTELRVGEVSDTSARGTARGLHPQVLKTAVKAVTLHGVFVEERDDGWSARVVLDV